MKTKKLTNFIEEFWKEENAQSIPVSIGGLFVVWFITPLTIGIQYLIIFKGITEPMAWSLFGPSLVITIVYIVSHKRKFWSKVF